MDIFLAEALMSKQDDASAIIHKWAYEKRKKCLTLPSNPGHFVFQT